MGLTEAPTLYEGPPHAWRVPRADRPLAYALFALTCAALVTEAVLASTDILFYGRVRRSSAQVFAFIGIAAFAVANIKTILLALQGASNETLGGALGSLMRPMWTLHFWLNPLAVLSLGLFLLLTPRAQPPFYFVAYGVLLWQTSAGLLARGAVPKASARKDVTKAARAAHRQPAVFVLLAILVAAGLVESFFMG